MDEKKQFWSEVKDALSGLALCGIAIFVTAAIFGLTWLFLSGDVVVAAMACLAACIGAGIILGFSDAGLGGWVVWSIVGSFAIAVLFEVKVFTLQWRPFDADSILLSIFLGIVAGLVMFTSSATTSEIRERVATKRMIMKPVRHYCCGICWCGEEHQPPQPLK